jgi:hypothetical protein
MKSKIIFAIIAIILVSMVSTLLVKTKYSPDSEITVFAESGTSVGGIIWDNITWTEANSPYIITSTVQIPENVTLVIEPSVTVLLDNIWGQMFLVHGTLYAHGTINNKIVFDGGETASFFSVDGSTSDAFIDLEYCVIKNGVRFWSDGHGYFSLRNSELMNLTDWSYIWYPGKDVLIEQNTFRNTAGFSIGHSDANVSILNNFFTENRGFVIKNWASYGSSKTIIKFNSFLNMTGIVLELPSGYTDAAMIATENYWGTTNTSEIDSMIYDMNDDITCAGFINYLPILLAPHPDTPTIDTIPDLPPNLLVLLIVMVLSVGALIFKKNLPSVRTTDNLLLHF